MTRIRKLVTIVEEILSDGGRDARRPVRKAAAVAVLENPAIVGERGEYEHAAALLHPKLGAPLRAAVGGGKAIIPSAKKLGGPGTAIDVPLHFKDAAFVRTHYDAMEVRLPDAPRGDEIVLVVVVTDGGRPHPRIGGLTKDEAKKEDGLR
ncbi:MAG: amino acid synthesis family protein [Candidatus Rokuibacteriota bacterium]|nr:MAG: amino acid synthesis family protein [Candidatus Rokubacteria bacterium]